MTDAFNSMSPEEQAKYIQQTMRTILTDPDPSILDVALLPILATDPRNGFSKETRKELMDEFMRFTGTQNNQDLLSEQMKQINMSHASMRECAENARCNERKTGKWQRRKGSDCWECSQCHAVLESDDIVRHNFYYCYHCGADMRGE